MKDFEDIPFEDYLQIDAMSKTAIWQAETSLLAYKHVRDNGIKETEPMRRGTAGHAALLEPERFGEVYMVQPDFTEGLTTKDGKPTTSKNSSEYRKRVADWQIEHPTALPISHDFKADLDGMRERINGHGLASELVDRLLVREGSLQWECPTTGNPCKCRYDAVSTVGDDVIGWDYKVVGEHLRPSKWAQKAIGYGYHVGDAHYRDGFNRVTGEVLDAFLFVVQESKPPYDIAVYEFDRETVVLGIRTRLRLMRAIADADRQNVYPGLPEDIQVIEAPEWAFSREDAAID